jgi:parallel beta-helix repeat protein
MSQRMVLRGMTLFSVIVAAITLPAAKVGPGAPTTASAATSAALAPGEEPDQEDDDRSQPSAGEATGTHPRVVFVDGGGRNASDSGPGTMFAPYRTIGAAMRHLKPGDDVVVAPGTYRERIDVPSLAWGTKVTRVRAMTPHTVTVKGSTLVGGWARASSGVYSVAWPGEEPEQVYRSDKPLRQIGGTVFSGYPIHPTPDLRGMHASEGGIWPGRVSGGVADLTADSFTYDAATKRLYVRLGRALASGERLEVSTRRHVLYAKNAIGLTIDGLDFAHSNTSYAYRQGAVQVIGRNNTLRNLTVRDMDAACVQLIGSDSTVADSDITRCGQVGVTGHGKRLTFAGNTVTHNNTRGFNTNWEAGGMKLIGGLHDSTVRDTVSAYNNGDGIWIDWKNTANLIANNTTAYNNGFGIHYEASRTGRIRGNKSYGNKLRGINLLESAESLIQENIVFGNTMEGIAVADGYRSAKDPVLKPVRNRVLGNFMGWNDVERNRIQLVLPGKSFDSASDHNTFVLRSVRPRMSMGYMSGTNYPYEDLTLWQRATKLDLNSVERNLAMPGQVRDALTVKRLLSPSELAAVSAPGAA